VTIRAKLTLSITLMFAVALGALGYLNIKVAKLQVVAETIEKSEIIEDTVRQAARDALIQADDLLLLSYVKFLREQFPSLSYVQITWIRGDVARSNVIGKKDPKNPALEKRTVKETDPANAGNKIMLEIGIDKNILAARGNDDLARLKRNILRFFGISLIIIAIFSDWFSRKLTQPLAALSHVASEIGKGKLGVRLEWDSKDEVGELVDGFNHMSLRLEELDHMKKDFVSAVTHELRSPLGAIESFLNLMKRKMVGGIPQEPEQFLLYFNRIQTNVHRLSGFISDLLDVAKIERGKMECTLKPIRIQDVASEVVQFFEAKSQEQGVRVQSLLDPNLTPVEGDADRLRQVFVNLLSNALKFTPKGGQIAIKGEQFRENGNRFLEVSVLDTGKGMDKEDLNSLFKKFQQGKNITTAKGTRGTGLGLFIIKSIVEAHGGKVSVRSTLGKGSQFLFNLKMT